MKRETVHLIEEEGERDDISAGSGAIRNIEQHQRGCRTSLLSKSSWTTPSHLSRLGGGGGVYRHMLIGASTASAMNLNVPVSVRQPFDKAISELDEAANIFQEVAETGIKTGIHNARLCLHLSGISDF